MTYLWQGAYRDWQMDGEDCISEILKHVRQSNIPIVINGDRLFLVTNCLDLVRGYPLATLTPNINENKRLVQQVLNCEVIDEDADRQLQMLARQIGGVTITRKGKYDLISNGETVKSVSLDGTPRRCGGQGDVLSGSEMSPTVLGCMAGSALLRKAAGVAFESKRRSTLTSDIIELLRRSLEELCPAC